MEAMSPVFAARRRAEEFQALVEGTSTSRGSDARLAEFLEVVESLRETVPVTARPEFISELREQLLDEARTQARIGQGAEVAARLTVNRTAGARRRERRLTVAIGGLAIVGATTGMSVAAQSALPGDPLYPLKRAIENAQTGVQTNENAKGKTLLDNAAGRLEEVDELSRQSDDAEAIADTLQTFTAQASEASELLLADYAETGKKDSVERLRNFTTDSMTTLDGLETVVPEDARASLIQAAQTLSAIDMEALIACPSCGPENIAQIPTFTNLALQDLLGDVIETVANTQLDPPVDPPDGGDKETGQAQLDPDEVPQVDTTPDPDQPKQGNDEGLIDETIKTITGTDTDDDGKQDPGLLEGTTDGIKGLLGGLLGGG